MKDYKEYARSSADAWLHEPMLLLIVLAIPFFQYLGKLPLIDPGEGHYAEISREMLERGDPITPTLNYVAYLKTPPLFYWVNAASMKIFGLNEFAARFPSALCGLLTVLTTYLIARRLYDRRTALLSAAILATSAGLVLQSRIVAIDMMLTFWLTAALGAFSVASHWYDRPRDSGAPWYFFYLFCAMAVLTGGLIGILFPVVVIFAFLLLTRRWDLLARMRCGSGLLLFLAVVAPWFVIVSYRNPGFTHFFLVRECSEHFVSAARDTYKPLWLVIPALAITMLPWSFHILAALAKAWREQGRETGKTGLYLLVWVAAIFLFFSRFDSGPLASVLPVFPPLAILISSRIKGELERRGRGLKFTTRVTGTVLVMLGAAALGYVWIAPAVVRLAKLMPGRADSLNRFLTHAPSLSAAACLVVGGLLIVPGVIALLSADRKPGRVLMVFIICVFFLEIFVPRLIMTAIAQIESPRDLALKAASLAGREASIITVHPMPAVAWYVGRRVMIAGRFGNPESCDSRESRLPWFPDREALLKLWRGKSTLLIILEKTDFNDLKTDLHPPPQVVMESGRRLLISNH